MLIEKVRKSKGLQNSLLLVLLAFIYFVPAQHSLADISYVAIVFVMAYVSAYVHVEPVLKGLRYAFLVTVNVVLVVLGTIALFPGISLFFLLLIVFVAGVISTYFIGE